jgi:RNA polymerase sigma factor (TIGR02999 family)
MGGISTPPAGGGCIIRARFSTQTLPMAASGGDVTRLLNDLSAGRPDAMAELLPLVYADLRQRARRYMRQERGGHTLQPTALVHEAFLRLVDQRAVSWQNRSHFLAIASNAMRRVLVDHARTHSRAKRGGGQVVEPIDDEVAAAIDIDRVDLIALDAALSRLAARDAQQARVVELRYFGGLSIEEAAEVLAVSPATVKREWAMARSWLFVQLAGLPPRSDTAPRATGNS